MSADPGQAVHHDPVVHAAVQQEHRLVRNRDVRPEVHGAGPLGNVNARVAVLITKSVGTMWCAYLFTMISLVSFPQALQAFLRGDRVTGISWLSQSFLQLVLLPIIMVGQNVISAAQDARAEADHETLVALHTINVQQLRLLRQQEEILQALKERAG
jgi:hypothetical protein